jgi:predicted unusual protein kinase regulating ubiquinone biosynthesis (AarF/ABC1/UbiB family)
VTVFVAEIRGRAIGELETSVLVGHLFALARKHRIRPMAELSLVLLGMVTIEGIAKRLDPRANTFQEVAAFLGPKVAHRRLARGSCECLPQPAGASLPPAAPMASAPPDADGEAEPPRAR